jgi:hypothetical protein
MAALRGDALLARGASLLAASPDARLWAIAVCGPAPGAHGALADVPALLAAGADPSALAWPEWDYVAMAAAALRACADAGGYESAGLPCALNRYAALHGAALADASDDGALVALLARAASSVDVRGAYDNWTPLHVAIGAGHVGAVRALLLAGAHPLARRGGVSGSLPLAQALALPDAAASSAIAQLLRQAIARGGLPEPPPLPRLCRRAPRRCLPRALCCDARELPREADRACNWRARQRNAWLRRVRQARPARR